MNLDSEFADFCFSLCAKILVLCSFRMYVSSTLFSRPTAVAKLSKGKRPFSTKCNVAEGFS